jgi:hypothetical protein
MDAQTGFSPRGRCATDPILTVKSHRKRLGLTYVINCLIHLPKALEEHPVSEPIRIPKTTPTPHLGSHERWARHAVHADSPAVDQIALFRSLFRGRGLETGGE